jgi:hypothetical protein
MKAQNGKYEQQSEKRNIGSDPGEIWEFLQSGERKDFARIQDANWVPSKARNSITIKSAHGSWGKGAGIGNRSGV